MLGSGSMGELTAIDQVEVVAGSSIMLGVCFVGLTLMRGSTPINVVRAGFVLMGLSFLATCTYVAGLIAVAYGWTTPSLFPDRYRENLIGSLLAILIGFLITHVPDLFERFAPRRGDS